MRVAETAGNCSADHAEADVRGFRNIFFGDGLPETGPAGAGVELGAGVEERGIAPDAAKDAWGVVVGIFVGVRALGGGVARDFERIGRELFAPVVFGLGDFQDRHGVLGLGGGGALPALDG